MTALQSRSPHADSSTPPPACPLLEHSLAAVLAAVATSDPVTPAFSPLVVWGPGGAGKSRWLARVFVLWQERTGETPALWDGATLGREIMTAIDGDTLDRLHVRFTARPLILIDGVEQVTHPTAQQTLAHLLDAAQAAGRCVVAAMRVPPNACGALEQTLATRLTAGLVISLPTPPLQRAAAESRRRLVPAAHAAATLRRVIATTARHYGLAPADLTGPSRRRAVAHARSMAMYLSRKLTAESLLRIGAAFGDRDHTTVMHSLRVTEERVSRSAALGNDLERLLERLLDHDHSDSGPASPARTDRAIIGDTRPRSPLRGR